jgi:hypothetical protein
MQIRFRSCAWVIASALVAAGCGGTDAAKRGVQDFRARVAEHSYAEIYRLAGTELQQAATEEEFEKFMTGVDRKLGAWQSSGEPGWNVTRGTGGHLVRLTYQSHFAQGAAVEQFVWRIERAGPVLLGYHVTSPLLATR